MSRPSTPQALLLPVGLALGVLALRSLGVGASHEAPRPEGPRQCGVALGLFASPVTYDYGDLLAEIASHGATDVLLSVPWQQDDLSSSHLAATVPPDVLRRTLRQAEAVGLRISLMPIVQLREVQAADQWRGVLAPDDLDAWFASYRALLLEQAALAAEVGAQRLVVGSELSSLESAQAVRWRALIDEVRGTFSGHLTWSANWDRFEAVPFWDALDEVGVSAWFALDPDDPGASWEVPQARLRAIAAATGKPVLLTEVGYPARASAAQRPWDHTGAAAPDPRLQADLFAVFFQRFAAEEAVVGAFVWNWFGQGASLDSGYTLRGRPAARVLKHHFARWCPSSSSSQRM